MRMRLLFLVLIFFSTFSLDAASPEQSPPTYQDLVRALQGAFVKCEEFDEIVRQFGSQLAQLKENLAKKDEQLQQSAVEERALQELIAQLQAERDESEHLRAQFAERDAPLEPQSAGVLLERPLDRVDGALADQLFTQAEVKRPIVVQTNPLLDEVQKLDAQLRYARSVRGFFMHKKGIPLCIGIALLYIGYQKGAFAWVRRCEPQLKKMMRIGARKIKRYHIAAAR